MMLAGLLLAGCDRKPMLEPAVETRAKELETAEAQGAKPAETVASTSFPGVPTDYAAARQELLRRGLTFDPDKPAKPHRRFPELNCAGDGPSCLALFLERTEDGWRRYVVVTTDRGDAPKVSEVRYPYTSEGLLGIPPPTAADIPKLPDDYWAARKRLGALGYRATRAAEEPYRVCAKAMASSSLVDCPADTDLPEVADCSGTGAGICTAYWIAPDERVLAVTTIGEPQPGGIYHLAWAKPEELKALPAGWRTSR